MKEPLVITGDRDFNEEVQLLMQEGRRSEPHRPRRRETVAELLVGGAFVGTALAMVALLPEQRSFALGTAAVFALAYAVTTRIQFDVGAGYTAPTQLIFVPMLFALPPRAVPLVVALGLLLGDAPDYINGRRHVLRAVKVLGDSWYAVGPALILALAGSGAPVWSDWPIYVGALAAQLAGDLVASITREWLGRGIAPKVQLSVVGWVYLVDVLLAPAGLLAAFASRDHQFAFLLLLPLTGLLVIFARERGARIENALGLSKAYRQTAELNARLLRTEREATRAREDLIAAASHEMQTPLSVLIGLIQALSDGLPRERHAETYAAMRRQAVLLRHHVRQFLDYTRLKAGRPLSFRPRPASVRATIEEVVETQAGQGRIELDVPDGLPPALVDPDRLHQVLMNIVSNAVKFSPAGSATTISARSKGPSVEISVIDRGPGIESSELPQLFEEFQRGSGGQNNPGTGLGLYMTRMLAEPQGAVVTVASRPGEGSRFTVVLPCAGE